MVDGWKYYNHAVIPTCAPHEEPNMQPIKDGSIWKIGGGTPLLARWTSNWDCGYETNWWYVIKDRPFSLDLLSKKSRKNIRKSLTNCEVRLINPIENADDLWRVFNEATERYSNFIMMTTEESFKSTIVNTPDNYDFWGGYDRETNRLIGYKICAVHEDWVGFVVSKYSTEFLKLRVSDALNCTVLNYYLNDNNKKYISNGERSIMHETNVQEYYQEHFGFRKANCQLNIKYRFPLNILIKVIYPFRKLIKKYDKGIMHQVASLLVMEELAKKQVV